MPACHDGPLKYGRTNAPFSNLPLSSTQSHLWIWSLHTLIRAEAELKFTPFSLYDAHGASQRFEDDRLAPTQKPVHFSFLRYLILPHITMCFRGTTPTPGLWIGLIGRNTLAPQSCLGQWWSHDTALVRDLYTEQDGWCRKGFPGGISERELWSWVPLLPLSASIAWM